MDKITSSGIFKQVWLAMTASLGYLSIGLVRGFSSPAMPSMQSTNPELVPNQQALSWICAVPPLGALVGSLCSGAIMHRIGRKGALMLSSPLFTVAWLLIAYSTDWLYLVAARAFTGLCVGIVLPSAQIYVSESSHPKVRGILGSLPALFMAGGILAAYLMGAFLSWDKLAFASAVFPTLMLILLIPLPESPAWLRCNGRMKESEKAMAWLHREPFTANVEMFTINSTKEAVASLPKKEKSISMAKSLLKGKFSNEALFRKAVLMPFGLVVGILIFQQISGIDSIVFYTVSIFMSTGSDIGEYEATIIVGIVQLVATLLALFLTDWYGRKILLLFSGAIMGISMVILGLYFHFNYKGMGDSFGHLPIWSMMGFVGGYSIGFSNIPFILMGELLPLAQRSVLSSVAGAFNLGSMFVVIMTFPTIDLLIGLDGAFWLYAVFCFLSCFFVYFLLPETKGKSLEDIEAFFEKKFKNDSEQCKQSSHEKSEK